MEMKLMLTVQQLAEKLNITPQAVYKKMNQQLVNELKPFVVETKRGSRTVKMIKPEGVEIIANSVEQPVKQPVDELDNNGSQLLIKILEETILVLREQLTIKDEQLVVKDNQIKELTNSRDKQLESKDKQIERLGDLIESNQELNKNNQILLHRQQDQPKMIEGKEKKFSFRDLFSRNK